MSALAKTLNERHVAAKEAERASVSLYALVYFRDRPVDEVGYLTQVRPNGVGLLVPRYGLEGWVQVHERGSGGSTLVWSEKDATLSAPGYLLRAMDRVRVRISVDTTRLHPRLDLELLDSDGTPLLDAAALATQAAKEAAKAAAEADRNAKHAARAAKHSARGSKRRRDGTPHDATDEQQQ